MKNRKKTLIIVAAAILVAGIGFGAGMMAKSSLAADKNITVKEAKVIALSDVGVSEGKATFTKAKLDDDNHYEIEFYTNSTDYEFEIDAASGKVIEKESYPRSLSRDGATQQTPTSGSNDADVIGTDAAKKAALAHANLGSADFTKAQLDTDDGIRLYDIEFHAGGYEYEYEINAYSGAIIEWDKEECDEDCGHGYGHNGNGSHSNHDHDDHD